MQEGKRIAWGALQIAEKRREVKGKVTGERFTQLNTELQRRAKRQKKTFFNEECKEIEKNNRLGKPGDLFKEIGDIKGTFHARMGTIKDRNSKKLTEAEDINKMWQEYKELYKRDLNEQDNHDALVTHLETDILSVK